MLHRVFLMFILSSIALLADQNVSVGGPNYQEISPAMIQIATEQSDSIQHFDRERLY
jgi:hypothetical protein